MYESDFKHWGDGKTYQFSYRKVIYSIIKSEMVAWTTNKGSATPVW
jgi:hypothetical protein